MNKSSTTKKSKNGFFKFLLDYRRIQAENGNQMDMMQSQMEAGEIWERMPPEERSKYSQSKSNPEPVGKRYNSFGMSFDEFDRHQLEKKQQTMTMELTIETILSTALETNTLDMTTFFFLSTSAFAETLGGDIYPAELAMSKFSLTDGVFDSFNLLINPGLLPLGSAADALIHAKKTHQRDLPPDTEGEKSFEVIFNTILNFMGVENYEDKKSIPPIFAESGIKDEEFIRAKATVEKIVYEAGKTNNFRVFPIESLLFKLNKKCVKRRNDETGSNDKPFSSIVMTKDMLNRDKFMYANIGCEFHQEKDSNEKCCLSKVKRFGYSFVTYCLSPFDENLVAGYHYPFEARPAIKNETQYLEDKEWEDQVTESFQSIRINSGISVSQRSTMSFPSTGSCASMATSTSIADRLKSDSESSVFETGQLPSIPSVAGSSFTAISGLSISEMIRGRGGKKNSTRGGKSF